MISNQAQSGPRIDFLDGGGGHETPWLIRTVAFLCEDLRQRALIFKSTQGSWLKLLRAEAKGTLLYKLYESRREEERASEISEFLFFSQVL